ncbi:MAG: extracellular solute-binding protein [Spirochaetaceae bacterium]|jgi:raffinose/stachyose/melibiose transport system substrate-binding protein|nr:extracellular solute-binding protein [Spirochaetaceae bacterium]
MKRILVMAGILFVLGCTLIFAGGQQSSQPSGGGGVVLNYPHYAVGTHLSRPAWEAFYARFSEKYKGQISLKIEELPSDTVYNDKMKVLVASKELPDVVDGKNGVRDLAIQNGQAVELTSFLNRDPDFRDKVIGPAAIAANTINGKIYSIVSGSQIIGYYYNKELFQKAGITPAKTWDEWFSNCEKLKALGVAPLALMTGENSWTTNLILSAMVASRGSVGQTFMNTKHPKTYQTPEMIAALADMQKCLQNYTTPDALGALYANAANNFLMEQAAIIANGPWMIADFSNPEKTAPGFDRKVGWAMYPGDGLVSSYAEGYVLCSPPERVEAGWTFLKELCSRESQMDSLRFMGALPVAVDLQIPADVAEKMPMVVEHANAVGKMKYHGDTFDVTAYASVVDAFGRYYPELAAGTLTPAAMAARLDEAAAAAQ